MHLKTIINHCCDFKGFVVVNSQFNENKTAINVTLRAVKNSKPVCSVCGQVGTGYDRLKEKAVQFIPFWGFQVFFLYAMRRVDCPTCGVKVERVPWASGKNRLTNHYANFLASWAKELSWSKVAERFGSSWQTVFKAVQMVVAYGLAHRRVDNVTALGVDEVQFQKGHNYMTLVYQINKDARRLLWVGEKRTKKTLRRFFSDMWKIDRKFRKRIEVVCSDMWRPYLDVIKEKTTALNVLDRFHIMQKFGKALDQIRAQEVKRLKEEGSDPVLKHTRWCFLKRKFNLTKSQKGKLKSLVDMNLNTVKAYVLKELFHKFWDYKHPTWAGKFLDNWCELAKESELEPMIKIAEMLQQKKELTLNYFRAKKQFNSGIVEGMNRKVNLTTRKAFGFRSFDIMQTALYHQLGELPEPYFDHEFW